MMGYETTKPIFRIAVKSYRRGAEKTPKPLSGPGFEDFPNYALNMLLLKKARGGSGKKRVSEK
jgi:hypothetical protein